MIKSIQESLEAFDEAIHQIKILLGMPDDRPEMKKIMEMTRDELEKDLFEEEE